jgi:pseudouridine-5'-phosphate glycosidase
MSTSASVPNAGPSPLSAVALSEEVREAVGRGAPVVALESTIIAHGLPRPRNLQVARELEDIVRAEGAVPATVAVLDGVPRVGLTKEQVERVAEDPAQAGFP